MFFRLHYQILRPKRENIEVKFIFVEHGSSGPFLG